MEAPAQLRSAADQREDITIARREYDDENVIAIDFGLDVEASVDVLEDTAIVVAGDRQFEFEIPAGTSEITTNDGILLLKSQE